MTEESFPRELYSYEKKYLFSVLPEEKSGYKKYRNKIENLFVIGFGRFERTNKILGKKDDSPELDQSSAPVFAIGKIECEKTGIDITIHEEQFEQIEFDVSPKGEFKISDDLKEIKRWSYSNWNPGDSSPVDNSFVREITIKPDEYLLAIEPGNKKIWIYEFNTGVNYLIPVTNFYNQLMIIKKERQPEIVQDQKRLFENNSDFTDEELVATFIMYNKYFKRIPEDFSDAHQLQKETKKKKGIFKFLKR